MQSAASEVATTSSLPRYCCLCGCEWADALDQPACEGCGESEQIVVWRRTDFGLEPGMGNGPRSPGPISPASKRRHSLFCLRRTRAGRGKCSWPATAAAARAPSGWWSSACTPAKATAGPGAACSSVGTTLTCRASSKSHTSSSRGRSRRQSTTSRSQPGAGRVASRCASLRCMTSAITASSTDRTSRASSGTTSRCGRIRPVSADVLVRALEDQGHADWRARLDQPAWPGAQLGQAALRSPRRLWQGDRHVHRQQRASRAEARRDQGAPGGQQGTARGQPGLCRYDRRFCRQRGTAQGVGGGRLEHRRRRHVRCELGSDLACCAEYPLGRSPRGWQLDRSYDDGSSRPFSVGWWLESNGEPIEVGGRIIGQVSGDLIRLVEWYGWNGKPNEGLRMPSGEIASGIVQRQNEWRISRHRSARPGGYRDLQLLAARSLKVGGLGDGAPWRTVAARRQGRRVAHPGLEAHQRAAQECYPGQGWAPREAGGSSSASDATSASARYRWRRATSRRKTRTTSTPTPRTTSSTRCAIGFALAAAYGRSTRAAS